MSRKICVLCLLALFSLSLLGCTTRLVDFTIISTKNIDLSKGAAFQRGQSRIEGEDKASIIIFIPTGNPNIKEAVDRAIESIPGAIALLDGVVEQKYWYIPYIYGEMAYVVEGTPLIDPQLASTELPSNYIISNVDKEGNVVETIFVSKAEYETARGQLGL